MPKTGAIRTGYSVTIAVGRKGLVTARRPLQLGETITDGLLRRDARVRGNACKRSR